MNSRLVAAYPVAVPHSVTGREPITPRSSGVLLHVSSLPDGTLGGAPRFIDWLVRAGQSWWQVLPLGPPDGYGSPYASPSAFACWRGYLAHPDAPVTDAQRDDLRATDGYWLDGWARHAGAGALDDQVRFAREWSGVRAYAAERGIRILGDVPFYVSAGAADVLAHPELFRTDVVAGVPPDDFSDDGQLWGNPPYDWDAMRADGYRWWVERLRRAAEMFDAVRIDHFRGFAAWWAVPPEATTARVGRWLPGPGPEVIRAARAHAGDLAFIAEDLGVITDDVVELLGALGLPGMRVLQYAFGGGWDNPHRLGNHPERAMVVTGTHDNDTIAAWWHGVDDVVRHRVQEAAASWGVHEDAPHRALIRLAFASRAGLAVVPVQDVLGLGSEARFNTPGTVIGNWSWRLEDGQLTDELADWLRHATDAAARRPTPPEGH